MSRLISKFKYLKPHHEKSIGGYAKYIATREGVEKIDDSVRHAPASQKQQQLVRRILKDFSDTKDMLEYEDYLRNPTVGAASEFISRALEDNAHAALNRKTYADYIATRPRAERIGSHGLFTDDGVHVQLSKVSEELNHHAGNVWTIIISLRREDAERLGFSSGARWRDMLRTQTQAIANNFKIPIENLRWYASFHNESHHPHAHVIVYSKVENEGYLTKKGVHNLRSSFSKDIFVHDLETAYEKQKTYRDDLRLHGRELIAEIVSQINSGVYDNPALEEKLLNLADRLSRTGGKKQYGYLKADVKAIVDSIVDDLAGDERIAALYDLWYQQREEVIRTYTDEIPQRIALADNNEFKTIKNAVIQEAMNIVAERTLADEDDDSSDVDSPEVDPDLYVPSDDTVQIDPDDSLDTEKEPARKKSWWTDAYKQARTFLYSTKDTPPDLEKAFALMQLEAETGNGFAMHDLGKMLLSGLGCDKDEEAAQQWFEKALEAFIQEEANIKNPAYLQYRIGKMYAFGYGANQDYLQAAQWYEKAVAQKNVFAAYSLGSLYHRGQGVAQDEDHAYALFLMAANDNKKPNAYAAYTLGHMCREGVGTAASKEQSDNWYRRSYTGFLSIEEIIADDKLYYRLGQMNLSGTGTETDLEKAEFYFRKAADLNNTDALYGLGKLYLNKSYDGYDPQKAIAFLIEAAKQDHEFAQYTLGKLFLKGEAVPKNISYALRWLEEAAAKGNPYAEYLLGKSLLLGDDVDRDSERGEALLRKAADNGNIYAAYTLGKALLEGNLLLQDVPEALRLITQAADGGFSSAQYLLGKILYRGEVIAQDIPKALSYLGNASVQDHPYAAYLAGKILLTEESVKDVPKAILYFEIASDAGNDFAEYQLGKLYLYGKEVSQDYEKAMEYLSSSAAHGNQYAAQLLHSIQSNRNWSAALGTLRLFHHLSQMIQKRLEDEWKHKAGTIDRKLKRIIDEKKQAHGLKQG